jgi:hypothetical protein
MLCGATIPHFAAKQLPCHMFHQEILPATAQPFVRAVAIFSALASVTIGYNHPAENFILAITLKNLQDPGHFERRSAPFRVWCAACL